MAVAIGQSSAMKLLLPVSLLQQSGCGVRRLTMNEMIVETIAELKTILKRLKKVENNIVTCCSGKGIEIQDVFKYLYQSCFGCEHLSTDYFSLSE